MNAKELFKKRVDEVNELATTYNVMQARFEVLETENSQLKGDIDTLQQRDHQLRRSNDKLVEENAQLHTYCDTLGDRLMAPDGKTIDNAVYPCRAVIRIAHVT